MPGAWLLILARVVFDEAVLTDVVQQTIADMRSEWMDAGSHAGRRLRARWLGYIAFWSLVVMAPVVFRASKENRRFLQIQWRSEMSTGMRVRLAIILVLTGVAAGFLVSRSRPVLYRASAVIQVIPARVSAVAADQAWSITAARLEDRVLELAQITSSYAHLERVVQEFDLYGAGSQPDRREDAVQRLRERVEISPDPNAGQISRIVVSFRDESATAAQKVTERLTRTFIEESLRSQEVIASGAVDFLSFQIQETGARLEAATEKAGRPGRRVSTEALELEVLQNSYKSMLARREEALMTAHIARTQLGEQFKLLESPRLPRTPEGPETVVLMMTGGVAGLVLAVLIALTDDIRRFFRRRRSDPAVATAEGC